MKDRSKLVLSGFNEALDRHGFGFHYAVLDQLRYLFEKEKSRWSFEAAEFPVALGDDGTRIDFIMKDDSKKIPFYMTCECKRVNPALSNWCFIRAPYTRRDEREGNYFIIEHFQPKAGQSLAQVCPAPAEVFGIGLEIRSQETGDSCSTGRGDLEKSCTQAIKGMNGIIEQHQKYRQVFLDLPRVYFLPVVFTTANLYVSSDSLSEADLNTGKVTLTESHFEKRGWVLLNYHITPTIKHSYYPVHVPSEFGKAMEFLFMRTIAFVGPSGIEDFMRKASSIDLDYKA